jgi:DNA modification methylase
MKTKEYQKILPLDDDSRIIDQFGFLPLSVMQPTKESKLKWPDAYMNNDEIRRGNTGYLPNYKFSEFHAGLAENIVRYWSVENSNIVDCFAGRVTRAVVSMSLKRNYYGYEISKKTLNKSINHLKEIGLYESNYFGNIYNNDGCKMEHTKNNFADLVFTCPPYHNLEKYESCDNQLSDIKNYEEFLEKIKVCAFNIHRVLKNNGFCVWVCADWRSSKGLNLFHNDTIQIFKEKNLIPYDVIILKNISPFAALQAGKVASKRYTSKIHEYILVFRKL